MEANQVKFTLSLMARGIAAGAMLLILGAQPSNAQSGPPMGEMPGKATSAAFSFGEPGLTAKVDRKMAVTMNDMSFEPAFLEVRTGETVRFTVVNKSQVDHDFTIGDDATQKKHRAEMLEMIEKAGNMDHHDDPNAISVKAGETKELIWKFSRAGKFEFDCNMPGHYEAGMKGVIAVTRKGGEVRADAWPSAGVIK